MKKEVPDKAQIFKPTCATAWWLLGIAFCLSVCLGLDQNSPEMCVSTTCRMADLQAIASHLPVILIKVYDTGRWAHINVKLLHCQIGLAPCSGITPNGGSQLSEDVTLWG